MVIHDLDDLGYPDRLETSVYVFVYHCNLHLHNTAVYTPSAPSLLQVSIVIQKIQWLGGSQGIFSKKLWENAQDLFRKLGKTMGKLWVKHLFRWCHFPSPSAHRRIACRGGCLSRAGAAPAVKKMGGILWPSNKLTVCYGKWTIFTLFYL